MGPRDRRIAYTGASGSTGSQMPADCIALHTRLEASVEERVLELRSIGPIDAIIHLAALVSVPDCEARPEEAFRSNRDGAVRWFEAAALCGISRFVHGSTSHVFAPPSGRSKLTSSSPVGPVTVYARSKLAGEEALLELYRKTGVPRLTIARVFSVLSPLRRKSFLLTGLHERAERGDFSPIPGLSSVRDFLWADEICRRLMALCEAQDPPLLALICSGEGTEIRKIAAEVFQEHGLDPSRLVEAPAGPNAVPYLVGEPTVF